MQQGFSLFATIWGDAGFKERCGAASNPRRDAT
jgi:hypothetical protein